VAGQTPPTFLFHTNEDTGVPPENSVLYYLALAKAKAPAEMHNSEPVGMASGWQSNIRRRRPGAGGSPTGSERAGF